MQPGMNGYLEQLTIRLATGVASLPEEVRQRHAKYLLAAQRDDGGFAGREGGSDLYYTSFALRGLAVLGELHGDVASQAAAFLKTRLRGQETIVDFFSLLYGAALIDSAAGIDVMADAGPNWKSAVAGALEKLRRPDGGYAKGEGGVASSTYHTFLVLLCREWLGQPPPEPHAIVAFLNKQRAEDGGFLEIKAQKRAGTNPTAAAVASLKMLNALDKATCEETIDFLLDLQVDEGGLRANTRIPIADLLSTFTGLLTLQDLGGAHELDLPKLKRFVQSLEQTDGGFHGAEWDAAHDVEYSFYGIGCLGLLEKQSQ